MKVNYYKENLRLFEVIIEIIQRIIVASKVQGYDQYFDEEDFLIILTMLKTAQKQYIAKQERPDIKIEYISVNGIIYNNKNDRGLYKLLISDLKELIEALKREKE